MRKRHALVSGLRFSLFEPDEPRVGVILGTGPSLTAEQIKQVKYLRKFGVNNTHEIAPLDVHLACNVEWYNHYGKPGCPSWIAVDNEHPERLNCAIKHGLDWVEGKWLPGLSTAPDVIHYHHGAGPQIINLALHYGCETMILLGWDMRYPPVGKRHYFGEYPPPLLHYPKTGPHGEFEGLIREMETIRPADYGIEIINCTPESALTCYPCRSLSGYLKDSGLSRD